MPHFRFNSATYPHLLVHFRVTQVTQPSASRSRRRRRLFPRAPPGSPESDSIPWLRWGNFLPAARLPFGYARSLRGAAPALARRNMNRIRMAGRAQATLAAAQRPREFDVVTAAGPTAGSSSASRSRPPGRRRSARPAGRTWDRDSYAPSEAVGVAVFQYVSCH